MIETDRSIKNTDGSTKNMVVSSSSVAQVPESSTFFGISLPTVQEVHHLLRVLDLKLDEPPIRKDSSLDSLRDSGRMFVQGLCGQLTLVGAALVGSGATILGTCFLETSVINASVGAVMVVAGAATSLSCWPLANRFYRARCERAITTTCSGPSDAGASDA
jgi:hypothetical protein